MGVIILSGVYNETESVVEFFKPPHCIGSLYVRSPYWSRQVLDGLDKPNAAA